MLDFLKSHRGFVMVNVKLAFIIVHAISFLGDHGYILTLVLLTNSSLGLRILELTRPEDFIENCFAPAFILRRNNRSWLILVKEYFLLPSLIFFFLVNVTFNLCLIGNYYYFFHLTRFLHELLFLLLLRLAPLSKFYIFLGTS